MIIECCWKIDSRRYFFSLQNVFKKLPIWHKITWIDNTGIVAAQTDSARAATLRFDRNFFKSRSYGAQSWECVFNVFIFFEINCVNDCKARCWSWLNSSFTKDVLPFKKISLHKCGTNHAQLLAITKDNQRHILIKLRICWHSRGFLDPIWLNLR